MAWFFKLLILSLLLPCLVAKGHNHNRYDRHREALKNKKKYPGYGADPAKKRHIDELPRHFDWCDVDGKSYCTPSWNQHQPKYCGACYVHGTLSAVQDRLKIMRNGEGMDVNLARQVILNCGKKYGYGSGCGGGESSDIYEFMRLLGLPDEGCYNYLAEENKCPDNGQGFCVNCMMFGGDTSDYRCWPVDNYVKYHVKEYGEVSGEAAIMSEVYARGPVTCGLVCPDEFVYGYKGGVFHYHGNETDVDHDVEVVGWGEENGVPYWKVRNSWGTYWGENGFFRVYRGSNNLRIEEMCTFAIPENAEEREQAAGGIYGSMFGISRPHSHDQWRWKAPNPKGKIPDIPDQQESQQQEQQDYEQDQAKAFAPVEAVDLNSTIPEESSSIVWQAIGLIFLVSILISCYIAFRFHKQDRDEYRPL